ncbi:MAG: tryptophan-rich sensory protein [Firmicutes bacterium]|nr:tryptophan-rich sensory protein [Bacillota bacterium]
MSNIWQEKKTYVFFIILCETVGVISGLLSMMGMRGFDDVMQSELTPPGIVFPIVWFVLYALMGIGAARIRLAEESLEQVKALLIFSLQLAVNFFWSIIFFDLQAFQFAFWWLLILWVLIILMIIAYHKVDKLAAYIQIPYLLWVTFAGYLTYMTWMMN